jgi:hypothetical protein
MVRVMIVPSRERQLAEHTQPARLAGQSSLERTGRGVSGEESPTGGEGSDRYQAGVREDRTGYGIFPGR